MKKTIEQAIVVLAALGLAYWLGRVGASLPFGLQWSISYMLTRSLFDALRRVSNYAVLVAVALALALVSLGAQHDRADVLQAREAWRAAEQETVRACRVPGSEECLEALDAERVAAARLCDVTHGAECP